MKPISEALRLHLQQEVTTIATCWKVTRRDDVVIGITDYDRDITFEGISYRASAAFQASAATSTLGLTADNFDLEGVLSDDAITQEDIICTCTQSSRAPYRSILGKSDCRIICAAGF